MEKILEEMMEYICDKRCRYPNEVEQEELDKICEQCAVNTYIYMLAAGQKASEEIKWLSWENGKEWGTIECPMLGNEMVMTYYPEGVPCYYSYTAPFVEDDEIYYYRYDHDEDCWDESVQFCLGEYEEGIVCKFGV